MPDNSGNIKVDDHFITEVRDNLSKMRNNVSVVRGGANPLDMAHPRGGQLANLAVVPGSGNFQSGQDVKARVTAVAGQLDQRLAGIDQKLDKVVQGLDHVLASSDHVELTNMSLTDYGRYTGTGTQSIVAPPASPAV
ncbi:hypothetical protein [Actinoplanes sp. HUAS TT8]|uniref:hypothetical protein n=1 Tax=Actinoplanes sp. HUAS TT8 TaxID=3447453 RepID=UPI003F524FA6